MFAYQSEYLFTFRATLQPPRVYGPSPVDIRADFMITGGEVEGPALRGKVLPGGVDCISIRSDGVLNVDVRGALESHDGALIQAAYTGVLDLGPQGYDNFLKGVLPPELKIRAGSRFHSAHPAYQWLNRLQCYSIGEADLVNLTVTYDVYALR